MFIGKEVIIRCKDAGVFFGTLVSKNNDEVTLKNARKLFYWEGAAAVEQIAVDGVKFPDSCKFTIWVESIELFGVCQIIACTKTASEKIKDVKEWKM